MSAVNYLTSRYRVLEEAGHGGMGTVFHAIDLRLRREVALKLLSDRQAKRPHASERLVYEGILAGAVNHPNVCTIYDLDFDQLSRPFLVMEWLQGETLSQRLTSENLPVEQVLELAVQIAEGLEAAHSAGVIHRDLKPANIFLTVPGVAKILDFGLSTFRSGSPDEETLSDFSIPGVAVGTVCYLSPEEARGHDVDGRADLFSLGAVLFEAASGRKPFRGSSSRHIVYAILNEEPPQLRKLNPDIPRELDCIVHKLLAKSPAHRYATAGDLLLDLKALVMKLDTRGNSRRLGRAPCGHCRMPGSTSNAGRLFPVWSGETVSDITWPGEVDMQCSLAALAPEYGR